MKLSSSEFPQFRTRPPASEDELLKVQDTLGISLPSDYLKFLMEQDGGEGFIGNNYVVLWQASQLAPLNADYEIATYAPGFIGFGSNGGGEAFAFDTRKTPFTIVEAPFIGMSTEDGTVVASNFTELLQRMKSEDALF